MNEILAIYADGGVIGRNPSPQGGTWAYCYVSTRERVPAGDPQGFVLAQRSGLLLPEKCGTPEVTNNQSEFFALAKALAGLPDGWEGNVYSDSQVTIGRIFWGWKTEGIPDTWVEWAQKHRKRLGLMVPFLLDGHPTRQQLEDGFGKRGNPVSVFNVLCDKACGLQAKEARR